MTERITRPAPADLSRYPAPPVETVHPDATHQCEHYADHCDRLGVVRFPRYVLPMAGDPQGSTLFDARWLCLAHAAEHQRMRIERWQNQTRRETDDALARLDLARAKARGVIVEYLRLTLNTPADADEIDIANRILDLITV